MWFDSSLYILSVLSLGQIYGLQPFYPARNLTFILLTVFYASSSFNFAQVHFVSLSFYDCGVGIKSENSLPSPCEDYLMFYFLNFL